MLRWLLALTLLAICVPAISQTLENEATFSGYFTFSDFAGTVHQLHYADLDNQGGNNINMPGYDWQGDGSNSGPAFHVSCSATLLGTTAQVNRGTQSDTPPFTFPPGNWSNGQEVTIIDFKIDRSGTGGGGDCEAEDFSFPELSIAKSVNDSTSATVAAGGSFTYELVVSNTGDGTLENVNVVDELDLLGGALSVDSITPGSPTCELSGTTLDCVFAQLAEGASESITITMVSGGTTEGFCGSVQNSADTSGFDPVLAIYPGASSNVVDVDIVNCQSIEPGQIEIIKNTVGGNGSFDFSGDLGNFTITTAGGSGNDLSTNLSPGSYTVSETVPAGWSLTSISCVSDSGSSTNVSNPSATINLGSGGDVTCTFTNTLLDPAIEITKSDGGQTVSQGSSFAYGLSYTNTGELDLTGVVITETVPDDTTFNAAGSTPGWSCADNAGPGTVCELNVGSLAIGANGSVDFGLTVDLLWSPDPETGQCGEEPSNPQVDNTASIVGNSDNGQASDNDSDFTPISVSCDDLEAGLTVEKIVSDGDTSQVFAFTGSASDDGFSAFNLSHGQSQTFALPIGTYSVSESVPEGWDLESATCTGGNTIGNIELADGESVLCTFTNRELAPGIEITKTDGGQIVSQEASFAYSLGYSNTGELDLTDVVITETVPDDTTFNAAGSTPGWSCADGAGPGTVCEFNVGNLAIDGSGSVDFGLTVDLLWEPDPETGQCDDQPSNPQVDNTASIVGDSDNGQASDNDSDFTPISVSCDDLEAGLTVEKIVSDGDTSQVFAFTGSASDDGFSAFNLSHGQSQTFALPIGTYSVSESVPEGWDLESATCTGGNTIDNIELADGGSVLCTFTNRELAPGIEITKTDGGQIVSQEASFAYSLGYSNTGDLDLTGVVITETVPDDTTFNAAGSTPGWSCADGAGPGTVCEFNVGNLAIGGNGSVDFGVTVDLLWEPDPETGQCDDQPSNPQVDNTASIVGDSDNGQASDNDSDFTPISVACEHLEGVLIVEKLVSGGDTNESFQFSGSSSDDGFNSFSLSHDESLSFGLPVGTYSVSENLPEGWDLESATCTGGNTIENIELNDGESVTCTFTNRELDPGIAIHKSASSVSVGQGNDLYFILTYSNNGELDLTDVVITETVPENSTFDHSGPNANAWTCESGVCTHEVGNLPSGGSGEIRFPLTADMVWEPDPVTEECPPQPQNPRVNNTAEITGTSLEGESSDSDSASSAIIAICQDSGGEPQNPSIPIPVNHPLGMALLIMLMALLAGVNLQRRKAL